MNDLQVSGMQRLRKLENEIRTNDDSIDQGNKGVWRGCPYYHDYHAKKVMLWIKDRLGSGMTYNDFIYHSIRLNRCYDWLYANNNIMLCKEFMTNL